MFAIRRARPLHKGGSFGVFSNRMRCAYLYILFITSTGSWHVHRHHPTPPRRLLRGLMRMDDEVARAGIKQELTTKDEYLDTRFTKLSTSGHDLTPLTAEEMRVASEKEPSDIETITGLGTRGLYCSAVGGLPIYSSGSRLDKECNATTLVFSEPCDPEHIEVRRIAPGDSTAEVFCKRSGMLVARAEMGQDDCVLRHYVPLSLKSLRFHDLRKPFPIESRPESLWGTEDQFSYSLQQGSSR